MYYLYKDETYATAMPYIIISDNGHRSNWSETVQKALATLRKHFASSPYIKKKRHELTLIETFDEHSHPEYFV